MSSNPRVPDKDLYYVAVKVFLRDGEKLLVTHDIYGAWDIPGGRIRTDQFEMPIEEIIEYKLREELGKDFKYELGEPVVFMRHERKEQLVDGTPTIRIFAVGFEAKYLGGEITLWHHHDEMRWVDVKTFKPDTLFKVGWLKGVREYLEKAR